MRSWKCFASSFEPNISANFLSTLCCADISDPVVGGHHASDNTIDPSDPILPIADPAVAHSRLEEMLKETRLDLLSSMGETERYKQLFEEIPHLKGLLENAYYEVRDRCSRLLGHLRDLRRDAKRVSDFIHAFLFNKR